MLIGKKSLAARGIKFTALDLLQKESDKNDKDESGPEIEHNEGSQDSQATQDPQTIEAEVKKGDTTFTEICLGMKMREYYMSHFIVNET